MSEREIYPGYPAVGQFLIHIPGFAYDDVYDTIEEARAAAKAQKKGLPKLAVYVVQVVDIA